MKAFSSLPSGFGEILSINLQKNKKAAMIINISCVLIAAAMLVPALFLSEKPITDLLDLDGGAGAYFLRFGVFMAGLIAYMILHELVHGIAMHICGTKKVRYGFTGLYAFAGSDDYYDKSGYIFIALAPIAVWGVVLAVMCAAVPPEWFWIVYIIEIMNVSGAAGDIYVTVRFSRLPKDILVRDTGIEMSVYSAEGAADDKH
ncbi:MAG: DUF3267 domain-containing protein [Clostridiales bacterium]|nr:DUF3267 domain-containing protein [Clostridiales bacterium]